jgi:hypothetical protein
VRDLVARAEAMEQVYPGGSWIREDSMAAQAASFSSLF